MIDFSHFNTLIALTMYFNNEAICQKAIIESRWSDGDVVCPHCGKHHCKMSKNGRFHCTKCNHNFSCTVGTIFENTKVSLRKWFMAMYLIFYIGGKEKWKHQSMKTPNTQGRSTKTKTPVFGMMERKEFINVYGERETMSYVHAMVVEKTDRATLVPIIQQFIVEGSSVFTDELSAYSNLSVLGYSHKICNHGAKEFAVGNIYTNNIEGFWSHFRRMISGCYHDISDEHLQSYIDEACFRWNTRKMAESERFTLMFEKSIGNVLPNDRLNPTLAQTKNFQ